MPLFTPCVPHVSSMPLYLITRTGFGPTLSPIQWLPGALPGCEVVWTWRWPLISI